MPGVILHEPLAEALGKFFSALSAETYADYFHAHAENSAKLSGVRR